MKPKSPSHAEIAARAQQLYQQSGCLPGHDVDNWLQAEYELLQLPVRELAKLPPPKPRKNWPVSKSLIAVVRSVIL
jgi:hypothetical protein